MGTSTTSRTCCSQRMVSPTEVAAIVVESWLGEGGYVLPPEGWFRYLRELCDEHGILLVCDEVQSGVGRSGTMWAIEQEGVTPDVIMSGKGIASGLPLGAMIAREDLMVWELGAHGSTYGGLAHLVRGRARDVRRDRAGEADRQRERRRRRAARRAAGHRVAPRDRDRRPRPGPLDRIVVPGPHDRVRASSRSRSARGCSRSAAATPTCGSARRWCSARTRPRPRSRSSRRSSPRSKREHRWAWRPTR